MLRSLYVRWRRSRRFGAALAAPSRTLILRYHSVAEPAEVRDYYDPALSLPPDVFRAHVRALAERFEIAGPDALVAPDPAAGPRRVVVSFDDGLRNNLDVAVPILRECGATAVFYVTTAPVLGRRTFWISELWRLARRLPDGPLDLAPPFPARVPADPAGREAFRRALTRQLAGIGDARREEVLDVLAARAGVPRGDGLAGTFLDVAGLRALEAAGMTVGAHTRTHPHLDRLDPALADEEVAGSRADLAEALGHPVDHFAYPNPSGGGTVGPPARDAAARAGFRTAVTSLPEPLRPDTDRLRLPRLGVYAGAQERQLFARLARVRR